VELWVGFAEAGRPWRFALLGDSPQHPARHFTGISWQVSLAISSLQMPPPLFRRSDPGPASTGFRPFGIPRPPKTTLRHLHPSGSFFKISAHPRALVDSSSFLASIDHRSAPRIGPFSHRRPTIRPQPKRKARDDSPEPHRLPTARALRLQRPQRQRLAARKGPVNSPVTAQCQPSRRDASD